MNRHRPILTAFFVLSLSLASSLLLTACDNSGGKSVSAGSAPAKLTITVHGDEGPVVAGRVEAKDATGGVVATTDFKDSSKASLTIPAGAHYPLIVVAYPAETPTETLKAAITDNQASEQDISPVTTIVVNTALNLGGLTETNLAKAAGAAIAQRKRSGGGGGGGGATTESFKGDPTKQYGGWH